FAVDASVMEANASHYHGKAPNELDWTEKQRQKRAVAEYLSALDAEAAAESDAANDDERDDHTLTELPGWLVPARYPISEISAPGPNKRPSVDGAMPGVTPGRHGVSR